MAANPRRVTSTMVGSSTVMLTDHDGQDKRVSVADLIRPELVRAATLAYPGINGRSWLHQTNVAIRRALVNADLPAGIHDEPPPKRPAQAVPVNGKGLTRWQPDEDTAVAMLVEAIRGGHRSQPTGGVDLAEVGQELEQAGRSLLRAAGLLRGESK